MYLSLNLKRLVDFEWSVDDQLIKDGFRPEDKNKDFCISDYICELHTEQTMCEWHRWISKHNAKGIKSLRTLVIQSIFIDKELAELIYQFRRVYLFLDEYRLKFEKIDAEKLRKILNGPNIYIDNSDNHENFSKRSLNRYSLNNLRNQDPNFYNQLIEWKKFLSDKESTLHEDEEKILQFLEIDKNKWAKIFSGKSFKETFCLKTSKIPNLINPILEQFNKKFDSLCNIQKKFSKYDIIKFLDGLGQVSQEDIRKIYDDLISQMKNLNSSNRFRKPNGAGCVAVLKAKGKKYFALSGIDTDLKQKLPLKTGLPEEETDISELGKKLNGVNGYEYICLTSKVKRYVELADVKDKNSKCNFLTKPTTLEKDRLNPIDRRYYTCCERKLLANVSSFKNVFFIKFKPCVMCIPAMVSSAKKQIVSYVYSDELGLYEKKHVIKKIIVKKKHKKYQIFESFNITI